MDVIEVGAAVPHICDVDYQFKSLQEEAPRCQARRGMGGHGSPFWGGKGAVTNEGSVWYPSVGDTSPFTGNVC